MPLHHVKQRRNPGTERAESPLPFPDPGKTFFSSYGQKRLPSPQEDGGARRDRTDDLLNANQALSQLSYVPVVILEIV